MKKRTGWLIPIVVMLTLTVSVVLAEQEAMSTNTATARFASRRSAFTAGKKPYPVGTRAKWIAEGRVLGRAPEGYFTKRRGFSGTADNRGYLPPIGDQGSEWACVHFAGTYNSKTANMKRKNPSLDVTAPSNQCSPRFTYNLTNGGVDAGGYGHEPFEIIKRYGAPSLAQMPYVAGQVSALPVEADFLEGLHRRTASYVWVWEWDPGTAEINELKSFLDEGGVAVAGVNSFQSSFEDWSAGDPPWVGSPTGTINDIDHLIAVCGYGPGYYLLANSWGTQYGSNGFIVVDSTYFENYFSDVMYPLEGTYELPTSYAKVQIQHDWRSDIRSIAFAVNGTTVWSNSPLPRSLPNGTGSFLRDQRADWTLAVDLSSASWGQSNVVTVRCADQDSGVSGFITNFTVWFGGTGHVSTNTPVSIPDNTGIPAFATVSFSTGAPAWDAGYLSIGGGWRRLTWFGDYVPMGTDGWIWHGKHKFFFVPPGNSPASVWLYDMDRGWLWTSSTAYPFIFRSSPSAWLWYNGSRDPRWFVNMATSLWESWP
jgi:hypothetical protein